MKRMITIATAATLSLGLVASSFSAANAGKRERNILLGIGLGIVGGAIIAGEAAKARERRRARARAHAYQPVQRRYHGQYNPAYYQDFDTYEPPRHRRVRRHQRRSVYAGYGSDHVNWCFNQYRSYRSSDNTFQPYYGRRRQCYSPYN